MRPGVKLDAKDVMAHPRELAWTTYRDELPGLAQYLPNIDRIEVVEREEPSPGVVRLINCWYATGDIPAVARAFVKPEMLRWTERVTWDSNTWTNHWSVEPAFFTDHVTVQGRSAYIEVGPTRCEIRIDGDLRVDVTGVRGVPRLLVGQVNKAAERLVASLVLPNMQRLNRSVAKVLDGRRAARPS